MNTVPNRRLPPELEGLREFAFDIRWNRSHRSDRIWQLLDPETFELSNNPQLILEEISEAQLEAAARNPELLAELQTELKQRQAYLQDPGWFTRTFPEHGLKAIAYFSMEFGLTEALPIYSGGLGMLAGDYLKSASDLGLPLYGVGLLYQQGYFRQILSPDGYQLEAFPYNDPNDLPLVMMRDRDGAWLRIQLDLPGRKLSLRVWQATVGKIPLYLLDSNDPINTPWDRAITSILYAPGHECRFLQEVVLGIGGWLMLEKLGVDVDICHLNEGHAAFAILARVATFLRRNGGTPASALWATRPGNVFTTHTPVAAAFDRFDASLVARFAQPILDRLGVSIHDLLALGRLDPNNSDEPFNMACLALRGSGYVNGVSQLHGLVSRQIFQPLFPDWPVAEVPVDHVTNGVHVPTWNSEPAERFWRTACGHEQWFGSCKDSQDSQDPLDSVDDVEFWNFRAESRRNLIDYVRRRLPDSIESAIFRIAQESLANVVKHSQANQVSLAIRYSNGTVELDVRDDGVGVSENDLNPRNPRQLGLTGMRERATLLGGTLMIESVPGQGLHLVVRLPSAERS